MTKLLITDDKGKPVDPFNVALAYVRQSGRDGEVYSLRAADIDCTFEKLDGIVWPTSGKVNGKTIKAVHMVSMQAGCIKVALDGAEAAENPDGSVSLKVATPADLPVSLSANWLAGYLRTRGYEIERSGERLLRIKGQFPREEVRCLSKRLGVKMRWVRKLKDDPPS